jgi:hypothetical protein
MTRPTRKGEHLAGTGPARPKPVKAGTTTRVLEIYPCCAIAGYRFLRNNQLAGWGLRCGDDGSKWSRGTSPSPPTSLACWHTLTPSAGRAS